MCIKPVGTIDHSTYKYVVWYVVIPDLMILVGKQWTKILIRTRTQTEQISAFLY